MARNQPSDAAVDPAPAEPPTGRLKQFVYAYQVTKKLDPKLPVALLGWGLGVAVVVFALFYLLVGSNLFGLIFAIVATLLAALLAVMSTLSRRVQRSAYKQLDGQTGGGWAVIEQSVKRGWSKTPAVQFNQQQDMVHRLIGRAGIMLVAEGDPVRAAKLLANERKAIARYLGPDVPVDEVYVGDDTGAGQVPINKLGPYLTKRGLRGKTLLTPSQISEYGKRLQAIAKTPMDMMPKGPMPRGNRMPRGNFR
ncbi:MAG TPA: DUF4191 domain-containing protein [Actinocrinis sp.]|nr:DUF4191 domain-containing protein [Actinocrinis sp.]